MQIRSDIPYPKTVHYRNYKEQECIYPFNKMKVGDSFEIYPKAIDSVRNLASRYSKIHGIKLSILPYENSFRCWRVK